MKTTVVNIRREKCDVYIGRGSPWGNPFVIGRDGSRDEVVAMYEVKLRTTPSLMNRVASLAGKKLGCFCAPLKCHGDVLVKIIKEKGLE